MIKTTEQLAIFVLAASLAHGACDSDEVADIGASVSGIINGQETGYESWQSAISVRTGAIRCSGTLIHERLVLTAGHCVKLHDEFKGQRYDYDFSDSPEMVGIYGGASGGLFLAGADRVVVHPAWDGVLDLASADLALILLSNPVQNIEPSRLRDFPLPEEGETGIIVGYGVNLYPDQGSGVHRTGETAILLVDPYFLEVGGETNTCSGDSGGPLFTEQGGQWVVTGVTSFGMEDCPVDSGGYEINLLSYCDWLNRTVSSLVGRDLGLEHCRACTAQTVPAWGDPCGSGYPCCPEGTVCRFPDDFSRGGLGYCAPACCEKGSEAAGECGDVTSGVERCSFTDTLGVNYCAIHCGSDGDCPPGTTCENRPFESERICIASTPGPGENLSCDTEIPEDTESLPPPDTSSSTDSRPPSDTLGSDTAPPPDDGGPDTGGKGDGCGCRAVASSKQRSLLLDLFRVDFF